MTKDLPPCLLDLAELQRGVVCRSQVLAAGLSTQLIRCRVESGRWQRLHKGVYAMFTGAPDRQSALWAAVLRAGPGSALSYQTAAEIEGLLDKPAPRIHVTIPASRRATAIRDVVVHIRLEAEQATHPARLPPRTRLEETVLDLTDQSADVVDAMDWVSRAIGRRLTTQERLRRAAAQRAQLRWRSDLTLALSPELDGIHSALEYRYFRHVERPHGLPHARRQAPAGPGGRSAYRDVLYDEYGLIVELDGKIAHPGDRRWLDISRDNAAAATGRVTLRYGFCDLLRSPCLVAAQVADVLRLRGWPGSPRRCSRQCPIS
jgi:Transcriptional regulator, AbiEi antitoxin